MNAAGRPKEETTGCHDVKGCRNAADVQQSPIYVSLCIRVSLG